jgi:hypothetical protein
MCPVAYLSPEAIASCTSCAGPALFLAHVSDYPAKPAAVSKHTLIGPSDAFAGVLVDALVSPAFSGRGEGMAMDPEPSSASLGAGACSWHGVVLCVTAQRSGVITSNGGNGLCSSMCAAARLGCQRASLLSKANQLHVL